MPTYFAPGYFGPTNNLPPNPHSGTAGYTHTTLGTATTELARRLGDPDNVFWKEAELELYITDALRHWSLLAQYYKDVEVFNAVPTQAFYTLTAFAPDLRSYTVTAKDLIEIIQYHLMEPANGTSWTGTEQFNYQILLDVITRRRNQMLLETGVVLQVDDIFSTPPPVATVALADSIIDVRRVAWLDSEGKYRTLRQKDTTSRRSTAPRSNYTPSTPLTYMLANKPHVSMELSPPSNDVGTLQLVTCHTGATITDGDTLLGIPDDLVPILKWGVIADLLNVERATDVDRAAYCEARWTEGIAAAQISPSIWAMEVDGVAVTTTSLQRLDSYVPNWQNTLGKPNLVASAGFDLIALSPVPDIPYSVTANLTRKAPVPLVAGDFIQIGKEYIDILYDYCVHLATFKQAGDAFLSSKPQFDGFFQAAQRNNSRLKAQAFFYDSINKQDTRELVDRPREAE